MSFLYHEQCPSCGSKNNLARYADGHAFCFGCMYRERGTDAFVPSESYVPATENSFKLIEGEAVPLTQRGITQATCELYGYTKGRLGGEACQLAPIRDNTNRVVAQKVRLKDKQFKIIGKIPADALFGKHLVKGDKRVVITEGEIDAMSVTQAFGGKYPAVSIPNGCQSARKNLVENLVWLQSFQEVIIFFDNDEPGQAAARSCAEALIGVNVKLARLENFKDANDALRANNAGAITEAVYRAEEYKPDGIVAFKDILTEISKPVVRGLDWFLPTLSRVTYGRREGDLIMLGAGTGVGKTDWLTQSIVFDVMTIKQKVATFFLEQTIGETGKRVCGKHAGRLFHIPDGNWTTDELTKAATDIAETNRLSMYDSWGVNDWDSIKPKIVYLAEQGTKIFYIDHLTALATGQNEDERTILERVTADMSSLAKRLSIIMIVVSHLATPEGKSHEEGGRVSIRHFKGSRAIGFWAYFMFALERNQQADDPRERQITTFRVLKDRYTGQATGTTIPLLYDAATGLISEAEEDDYNFETEQDSF